MKANYGWGLALVCVLFSEPFDRAHAAITCAAARQGTNQVLISWNAVASRTYVLHTATSPVGPWQALAVLRATGNLLSFAVPVERFLTMMGNMEESFLTTATWQTC
jgi:hypothetical protein